MDVSRETFSVVVPVYNEEANLDELLRRLRATTRRMAFRTTEIILVSDGSTDATESMIRSASQESEEIRGVFLSRNFGHQAAVSTGLQHSRGSIVGIIDGDLQDPPEEIPRLIATLKQGADVAYGVRRARKEGVVKRAAYHAFYRLLRSVAATDIPLDSGDFCVMKRPVVEAMLMLDERNRFVRGLRAWVGYRQVGVEYERSPRFAGEPKYTLGRLFGLAYDGLFSFTRLPVRVMQFLGIVMASISLATAFAYFVWYLVSPGQFPAGFASLIISIWFLSGVQLMFAGIVGEYLVRNYDEARKRPVAIVRECTGPSSPRSDQDPRE